jgi:site-specific recombinase XerD
LVIPAEEVKNGQMLEFELPAESTRLLKLYVKDYRPRLTTSANSWLFPGRGDACKTPAVLGRQISDVVFAETGLLIHPHLFRHIAAKLFLDQHPGQYEVMRRVLNHRAMHTTVNFYAGGESISAARHFDNAILKSRRDSLDRLMEDRE